MTAKVIHEYTHILLINNSIFSVFKDIPTLLGIDTVSPEFIQYVVNSERREAAPNPPAKKIGLQSLKWKYCPQEQTKRKKSHNNEPVKKEPRSEEVHFELI